MKKWLCLLLVGLCLACDDGDLIVTTFDFDSQPLQRCSDFEYVFFKINSDIDESLALQFSAPSTFLEQPGEIEVNLNPSGSLVYRRFRGDVTADYFCNAIPPVTPEVQEQFTSTVGIVTISTDGIFDDNDGIPTEVEDASNLLDTDNDGILDIVDFDDDGDNVPTFREGVSYDAATDTLIAQDTDMDGIPDYLDPDDDNDGVLTIDEDANMDLNPFNDLNDPVMTSLPDYLNPAITTNVGTTAYREHTYQFTDISIRIGVTNLEFRNENGDEVIRDIRDVGFGTFDNAPDFEIVLTPDFN